MTQRLIFLVIGLACSAWSQVANHSWEVYAQASATNTDLVLGGKVAGFRLGTAWTPDRPFGLVADFGLQSTSDRSGNFSFTTIMGGPRICSREHSRLSGFLQAWGGAYRAGVTVNSHKTTEWQSIWGGGAGVNIRLTDLLILRPLEYDLLLAGRDPSAVLAPRVSSGLVFRFGH
jgi:hypothetical protein